MGPKQLKIKHDKFCWKCCVENAELKCSACKRSFHVTCANFNKDDSKEENWICDVCIEIDNLFMDGQNGIEMIKVIVNRVYEDSTYNQLKQPFKNSSYAKNRHEDVIVNPINLMTLYQKANANVYSSFAEFLADAHWIYHNNVILFSETHAKTISSRMLLDYFKEEIESVKKCAQCYRNANEAPNDWFTLVCDEPHLIVWAKMKGFNYWPAKVMSIDGQLVNVRFFGDHTHSDVPVTNCFLYTAQNPGRTRNSTNSHQIALKEANQYIKNIVAKFGSFKMVESSVVLNPTKLKNYITKAIPGIVEFRKNKQNSSSDTKNDDEFEDDSITLDDQLEVASTQSSMISNISNMDVVVSLTRIDMPDLQTYSVAVDKSGEQGENKSTHQDQDEDKDQDQGQDMDQNQNEEHDEMEPIDEIECDVHNVQADELNNSKNDEHSLVKVDEPVIDDQNEWIGNFQYLNRNESPINEDEPPAKKSRFNDENGSQTTEEQTIQNEIDSKNNDENGGIYPLQMEYLDTEKELQQNAMQMLNALKEHLNNAFEKGANDRRSLWDMKRALTEEQRKNEQQQNLLEDRIQTLEQSVKMLQEANALLQATDSKHKCAKCGKPIETVLLCSAGACGQIVLKGPETENQDSN